MFYDLRQFCKCIAFLLFYLHFGKSLARESEEKVMKRESGLKYEKYAPFVSY